MTTSYLVWAGIFCAQLSAALSNQRCYENECPYMKTDRLRGRDGVRRGMVWGEGRCEGRDGGNSNIKSYLPNIIIFPFVDDEARNLPLPLPASQKGNFSFFHAFPGIIQARISKFSVLWWWWRRRRTNACRLIPTFKNKTFSLLRHSSPSKQTSNTCYLPIESKKVDR